MCGFEPRPGYNKNKQIEEMNINDIKKKLYTEKPVAKLQSETEGNLTYTAELNDGTTVQFIVPVDETVSTDGKFLFEQEMDAKLMNRWIKI